MTQTDGRLNFDTKIDTKGFSKGLNFLKNQMGGLMSLAGKLAAVLAAAFSVKEIVETAAEVKALNSQFEQTFGSLQGQAQAVINSIADSSQILESRLKKTATGIYAFAKTSGMDSASALNMMNEALQVTADSAAYYDRSIEETAETLQSFLKGNFANDAALGLSATETTRNAKALEMFGKKYAELSEAQKQLALLQMVKDANALSGAMGQAAREADGWENVTGNLKEAWKQLLAVIGQPVLALAVPLVKQLTDGIRQLASVAQSAVSALGAVFGFKLETGTSKLAKSADSAAESYSDMADAAEAAQEANEGSLAAFDEINKLGDEDSNNSSVETPDISGVSGSISDAGATADAVLTETENKLIRLFERVKNTLGTVFEPLKSSWGKYGSDILSDAKSLFGVFTEHGENIFQSWTEWAGKLDLDPAFEAFDHLEQSLAPFADTIGEGLEWFTENVLQPLASWTIESLVPAFLDSLADAIDGVNSAWETAEPVIKERLWDKFLKPVAKWAGKTTVGLIKDLGSGIKTLGESITEKDVDVMLDLSEAIAAILLVVKGANLLKTFAGTLTAFVTKAKSLISVAGAGVGTAGGASVGTAFCAAVIAAIAGWGIGTAIRDAIGGDTIDEALFPIFDKITYGFGVFLGGLDEMVTNTVPDIIGKITAPFKALAEFFTVTIPEWWAAIKAVTIFPLADKIVEVWTSIENFLTEKIPAFFTETIPGFFKSMWENIGDTAESWALALGQTAINAWNSIKTAFAFAQTWFSQKFTSVWTSVKSAFSADSVKAHFTSVLTGIKNVFSSIGTWFSDKFSGAWDKIKEVFSLDDVKSHFDSVVDKIGEAFSNLLGIIKAPINAVIDAINSAFGKLNSFSIEIPHFDGSVTTFGFEIPEIPRLAQGTVVPANYGEFLAVLGDNKREAEVVSPVSAIKQAVMEAMVALDGGGSKQPVIVKVFLNGREIGQAAIDDINDRTKRNGRSPLK